MNESAKHLIDRNAASGRVTVRRRKPLAARVGVFGVGYYVYWDQFPGLLERLLEKLAVFERKVRACDVDVVSFGMVDKAQDAYALVPKLKAADLDLVFCDMLTYATSATFVLTLRIQCACATIRSASAAPTVARMPIRS